MKRALLLAACLAVSGCICTSPANDPTSPVPGKCNLQQPIQVPAPLDILIVMDNSDSMSDKQIDVAKNMDAFVQAIHDSPDIAQDFHFGVITTSVYLSARLNGVVQQLRTFPTQSGRLQAVPIAVDGGTVPGSERFLVGTDPDFVAKAQLLVRQGTSGSGQETPYEAARLALTNLASISVNEPPPAGPGNMEFFRDGARLLVIVVSDEDDCSDMTRPPRSSVGADPAIDDCMIADQAGQLTTVQAYFDIFSNLTDLTGAHREVIWAEIAPVSRSSKGAGYELDTLPDGGKQVRNIDCPNSFAPGFRHGQMTKLWRPDDPAQANLASICLDNYAQALLDIATLVRVPNFIDIANVPDPDLLHIEITRADGSVTECTTSNGGLTDWVPPSGSQVGRIHVQGNCLRKIDDQSIKISILCAG